MERQFVVGQKVTLISGLSKDGNHPVFGEVYTVSGIHLGPDAAFITLAEFPDNHGYQHDAFKAVLYQ